MSEQNRASREAATAGYDRLAAWAAVATAIAGAGYAIAFVLLKDKLVSGLFLALAPSLSTFVLVALYRRVRHVDAGLALWALLVGIAGALGGAIHGAYDLANAIHPPAATNDLPSAVDPRGLLTFGATGLALIAFAWLIGRSAVFPRWVSPTAYLLGLILVVTFLARLIVLDATSPLVLVPALAAGVLSPLVFLGLGIWLFGEAQAERSP